MLPPVYAIGPAGFSGAGRAMVQYLRALSLSAEARCHVCTHALPFALAESNREALEWIPSPKTVSDSIGHGRAIPSSGALSSLELANAVVLAVENAGAREVVIWSHYLVPYAKAGSIAVRILRDRKVKCQHVVTPCGSDVWQIAPQLEAVTNSGEFLNPSPDCLIVYSERFNREVRRALRFRCNTFVIPPPIDSDLFVPDACRRVEQRRSLGIPTSAFVLLAHSNMQPVKRVDLIEQTAISFANNAKYDVRLVIIGPGEPAVQRLGSLTIHRLGLRPNIYSLLPLGDVFLNLSYHDSFNIAAAEAMSCGLPIVTTNVIGLLDYVPGNSAIGGIVESSQSSESIVAEAVRRVTDLYSSPTQRREYGESGRRLVIDSFAPAKVASLLKEAISAPR